MTAALSAAWNSRAAAEVARVEVAAGPVVQTGEKEVVWDARERGAVL